MMFNFKVNVIKYSYLFPKYFVNLTVNSFSDEKKRFLVPVLVIALILSAFTSSTLWKLDEKNSSVSFELQGLGRKGTFSNLTTTINFDKTNLKASSVFASIDVKTIKVGNEKKEEHLLSPDFFDAEKFPKITFTSTEIKSTDSGFIAKGNLHMKDSTKIIELPFTFIENGSDKATFTGTMTVNASEYGVMRANKPGSDKVVVTLVVAVTK